MGVMRVINRLNMGVAGLMWPRAMMIRARSGLHRGLTRSSAPRSALV